MKLLTASFAVVSIFLQATQNGSAQGTSEPLNQALIAEITSIEGNFNADEGVYKISLPRTDVKVTVDGRDMPPFMGLTSWAAFKPGGKQEAMVMGDLVLFQDEVNPVMSELLASGIEVTALHNHFFYDEPKVYFMHIGGEGTAEGLAKGVRKAFDKVEEIRGTNPEPSRGFSASNSSSTSSSITASALDDTLQTKGQVKDGMYKAVFGRTVKMLCGCEAGKEMGVNTWAAFMGTDEDAIVDGDFVTFEGELQPVLKALRKANINIVAIHNHMEGENPKAIFLHYWGIGPAEKLAQGVKAGLSVLEAKAME